MKTRKLRAIFLCSVLIITSILIVYNNSAYSQDCRIIRVHGMMAHDAIRVEPAGLFISKGTCVIWLNRSTANEIKIVFKEGKKCASVTDAPTGFNMDDYGHCYVTSWLPFGGTSSLRFLERGTYAYEIQVTAGPAGTEGKKVIEGSIVVE